MNERIDDSSPAPCWELGQKVTLNGNEHTITDIDHGYGVLHLDGRRYSAPGDPQNDGIVSKMNDCVPNRPSTGEDGLERA
jgi:hypothetical protein